MFGTRSRRLSTSSRRAPDAPNGCNSRVDDQHIVRFVGDDGAVWADHHERFRSGVGQRRQHAAGHETGSCPRHRKQRRRSGPRRCVTADIGQAVRADVEFEPLHESAHRLVDGWHADGEVVAFAGDDASA